MFSLRRIFSKFKVEKIESQHVTQVDKKESCDIFHDR